MYPGQRKLWSETSYKLALWSTHHGQRLSLLASQ
jgi:hypothetical protein